VGMGRTYASVSAPVSYSKWLDALKNGRSYVSDGKTHLMNFTVGGVRVGEENSEVRLPSGSKVAVSVLAAAYLPIHPEKSVRHLSYDEKPYWDVERARIGDSRDVSVEIIANGRVVSSKRLLADGNPHELKFEVPVSSSSWIAARIIPAAHTNPVFMIVG